MAFGACQRETTGSGSLLLARASGNQVRHWRIKSAIDGASLSPMTTSARALMHRRVALSPRRVHRLQHTEIIVIISESHYLTHAQFLGGDPVFQLATLLLFPLGDIHLIVQDHSQANPNSNIISSARVCSLPKSASEVANFQIAVASCAASARLSICTSVGRCAGGRVFDQVKKCRHDRSGVGYSMASSIYNSHVRHIGPKYPTLLASAPYRWDWQSTTRRAG